MSNVAEIDSETLSYAIVGENTIVGVVDTSGPVEFIDGETEGTVKVSGECQISKKKFEQLCVAWLALNAPECLATEAT